MSLRIFIYGEDGFINNTLATSLSMLGFEVIGETENLAIADKMISFHVPDVAIFHVDYDRTCSIDLAKTIRKRFPAMGMVLITKAEDIRLLGIQAKELPIGISVVQIAKHGDLDALKEKIEIAPLSTKSKPELKKCNFLTDIQIETMRLLAKGDANSEIAKKRYVSEKSVEQILARIATELGIAFDRHQNSRVKILDSYYRLVNGRR
jgi:DNA-binding NarL/FixJ family response regulator